jgi:hypothetical protein
MNSKTSKKVAAALAAGAVTVAGTGVAFAYWTTTGSGTGSAGSSAAAAIGVTINQDTADHPLTGYVLGATKDVFVTATNGASYSQDIGNITVSVAASGASGACAASNWDVQDVADNLSTLAASGQTGATSASTKVATLQLKDLATNQDACQNVTPVLTFTAAQGS